MANKSDSKSNLNESTLPLLDDEANKEKIELKEKTETTEGGDATTAAADAKDAKDALAEEAKRKKEEEKEKKRKQKEEEKEKKKQAELEKQKKKEEELELKKQKKAEKKAAAKAAAEAAKANGGTGGAEASARGPGNPWCKVQTFTTGINLVDRDERSVNEHVNVNFEDIIGEPDATQGFDGAYRLSYGLFQFVRFWFYRILMTIISIPLALVWAVVFALLSVFSVWVLTPAFRVLDILFFFFHRLWNAFVRTFLDPVFSSIALVRSTDVRSFHRTPVPTYSGHAIVVGGNKYSKVATDDVCVSYKKSDSEDDVTDKQITLNIENI